MIEYAASWIAAYRDNLAATPAPAPIDDRQRDFLINLESYLRHLECVGASVALVSELRKLEGKPAPAPAPVVAGTRIESGAMIMKDGKAWGVAYSDGQTTAYGWVTPEQATIHDPKHLVKPTDATWQGSGYADELRKGKIVHVERRTQVIVKEQP